MKRIFTIAFAICLMATLTSCAADQSQQQITQEEQIEQTTQQTQTTQTTQTVIEPQTSPQENMNIKLSIGQESAVVVLYDNAAAADLISMLPLTISFEDYNSVEKIGYLPRELSIGNSPTECDPDVGSFAYYAPWGNLSVFYEDFRESSSLIPLGEFQSGIELFSEQSGEFTVTIEVQN